METAQRELTFLLADPERRLLRFIAERLPRAVSSDHLTACGILGAAVAGVAAALDQPRFLEPVDHPARGDRLDFEQLGELALVDPLAPLEDLERAPLRSGRAARARALVEAAAHQARDIAHQKA